MNNDDKIKFGLDIWIILDSLNYKSFLPKEVEVVGLDANLTDILFTNADPNILFINNHMIFYNSNGGNLFVRWSGRAANLIKTNQVTNGSTSHFLEIFPFDRLSFQVALINANNSVYWNGLQVILN